MAESPIILFDGVCNYCNSVINYAIRHDPAARLKFAPLQGSTASRLREQYQIPGTIDSVILVDNGRVYTHSDAAVRIPAYLSGSARILRILKWVPRLIREPIYKLIARNRYKWFGKRETCMVPSADVRARFLD